MKDLLSLIYKKRSGQSLTKEEIQDWISSLSSKDAPPDYQTASLLAFIYTKGMSKEETVALVEAMRFSGTQFWYKNFPKDSRFLDKHSTGGVGDKISLPLMPLVHAAHPMAFVPTITGRGLGHTGGTADKLESIPGLKTTLDLNTFYKILKKTGVCFLSQTKDIVPADRVLYALRNVTGTVESIPLIAASILSKKLSETLNYLLLDLKFGNGAFLTDWSQTEALAETFISVARLAKQKADVCITRMDTPLGHYSGNRLEVDETLAILRSEGPPSSTALTLAFAIRMIANSGLMKGDVEAHLTEALRSGAGFENFKAVVEAQGGSLSKYEKLRKSTKIKTKSIKAERAGYLQFEVRKLGLALVELGGGRKRKEDKIDFDVGFYHPLEAGERVEKNQEILRIFYRDSRKLFECERLLKESIRIGDEAFSKSPLIRKVLNT